MGRATQEDYNCVNTQQFQSTPSWGGRRETPQNFFNELDEISIHALVGRATNRGGKRGRLWFISIHALVGRATIMTTLLTTIRVFQSTPSWGGRLIFDSTLMITHSLFQSTPSWGGRLLIAWTNLIWLYFNPRPRGEGDAHCRRFVKRQCYFNPRPRGEGDLCRSTNICDFVDFNPRPRGEGD